MIDEPLAQPEALEAGKVQAQAGDLAYRCVKRATELALRGDVQAIATAPLNKEALHRWAQLSAIPSCSRP